MGQLTIQVPVLPRFGIFNFANLTNLCKIDACRNFLSYSIGPSDLYKKLMSYFPPDSVKTI